LRAPGWEEQRAVAAAGVMGEEEEPAE